MKIVLHNYWRSSASHRVRIGLGLKGLAYDYQIVSVIAGDQHTEAYRAVNPMAQVPTLELIGDDGTRRRIQQSLAILEYLDECWPDPPLLPRDPYLRARTRALAEIVNAGIQPLQNSGVVKRLAPHGIDEHTWVKPYVINGLTAFDRLAAETAGAFCVGDSPTIADCLLVPQLTSARRYGVEIGAGFERLLAIEQRCLALPAFADAAPARQPDCVPAGKPS